jgi:hypothetical protein
MADYEPSLVGDAGAGTIGARQTIREISAFKVDVDISSLNCKTAAYSRRLHIVEVQDAI